jgi:hypothetical protein
VQKLKRHITKFSFIVGLLAALAMATAAPALAAPLTGTGTLTGAPITGSNSASLTFTGTINGTPTLVTSTNATLTAADFEEPAPGWNITLDATQFTDTVDNTKKLNATALSVQGIASTTCTSGFSCTTDPVNSTAVTATYPLTVPTTAVKIYSATAGTGEGSFDIVPTFGLNLINTDRAGSYTSAMTVSFVAGP